MTPSSTTRLHSVVHAVLPFLSWVPRLAQGNTPAGLSAKANPGSAVQGAGGGFKTNIGMGLRADVIAGFSVALVLIPQSMSYAQIAGLPPQVGLYAAFLPCIIAALFGSSYQLSTGPVAIASLMTATGLAPLAGGDLQYYLQLATVLAVMVGVIQLALGVFRMGVLISFLSHPVVMGFTNAAALIIASSQLAKLFGVTVTASEQHYETVWLILSAAAVEAHLPTVTIGLITLAIILAVRKWTPKLPGVLIAVATATLISWFVEFERHGGVVTGFIPEGLPGFEFTVVPLEDVRQLVSLALAIAAIGFVEAISIAKAMAAQTRQRLDADQELIGQGLGNLTAGMFQSYPVSGSFSRSAVNFDAGAVTGFSSVVTGLVVAVFLLALTPLLYHLPVASLAAVIIASVVSIIQFKPLIHAWRVQRHDGLVAVITFTLTLLLAPHLEIGIMIGVALSLLLYLYRTVRPPLLSLSRHIDGTLRSVDLFDLPTCSRLAVLRFDGSLYFANSAHFEEQVLRRATESASIKYVLLDCEGMNEIDASGINAMRQLQQLLRNADITLMLGRLKRQVRRPLEASGLLAAIGQDNVFRIRHHAVASVWRRMDGCPRGECPSVCPLRLSGADDRER